MTEETRLLTDHVVLITGAGGGIGRAIAATFAESGAAVVVADYDAAACTQVTDHLRAQNAEVLGLRTDVTEPDQVAALVDAALEQFGRLDVVVNNAGISQVGSVLDVSLDEWRRVFAVNLDGPLMMLQRVLPIMLAQEPHPVNGCRGKVINVSSLAAEYGRPALPAYGASKAALNHLSRTVAAAYADRLVATTVLYPGNVKQGMWRDLAPRLAAAEGRHIDEVLGERWFQRPEEVARAALFIAATHGMELNDHVVTSTPQVNHL